MYIAITAFDDLKCLSRAIVFEDQSTKFRPMVIVPFPEGRASILFKDKVYDWYGREATPDPQVKKIIAPWGQITDYDGGLNYCCDGFIAELQNGKFAFVSLKYQAPKRIHDPNYSGTKYAITGSALNRAPYIDFRETDIIHDQDIIQNVELANIINHVKDDDSSSP